VAKIIKKTITLWSRSQTFLYIQISFECYSGLMTTYANRPISFILFLYALQQSTWHCWTSSERYT